MLPRLASALRCSCLAAVAFEAAPHLIQGRRGRLPAEKVRLSAFITLTPCSVANSSHQQVDNATAAACARKSSRKQASTIRSNEEVHAAASSARHLGSCARVPGSVAAACAAWSRAACSRAAYIQAAPTTASSSSCAKRRVAAAPAQAAAASTAAVARARARTTRSPAAAPAARSAAAPSRPDACERAGDARETPAGGRTGTGEMDRWWLL